MKKLIIGAAVIAVGAGAYVATQQNAPQAYNVLDYIPADTALFAGQIAPFPLKEYLLNNPNSLSAQMPALDEETLAQSEPIEKFLFSLISSVADASSDATQLLNTLGLADEMRSYFYTLGLLPVLKVDIANPQAIWDLLDKAELDSGITHQSATLKGVNYRTYTLTDSSEAHQLEAVVAIDKGLLTLTLNSDLQEPRLLEQALGLIEAKNSLAQSGELDKIIKQYNFDPIAVAFLNHVEIIKGLTTTDGNQMAKQIQQLEEKLQQTSPTAAIRNEQCATELGAIAQNWPRTVSGYTHYDISPQNISMSSEMIVESKNKVILDALTAMRGFLPSYSTDMDNYAFALGLGIEVNNISSSLSNIWDDLQTPSYGCPWLAQTQAQITAGGQSLAVVSMGANMANGVQGLSAGVIDYGIADIQGNNITFDYLNALVAISADHPKTLFNSVKAFLPALQGVTLEADGEALPLSSIVPLPASLNVDPQLAIKGKHLIIYNGEKGEQAANQLGGEALAKNGLTTMSIDMHKASAPLIAAAELSGETIPEDLSVWAESNMQMTSSFDINEQGIIIKSTVNNRAIK